MRRAGRRITAALALALALLAAGPAAAQHDWDDLFGTASTRSAGFVLLVYDPALDDYVRITFEDLLAGLVAFDDDLVRYVALKASTGPAPTFSATELKAGTSSTGFLTGIELPTVPMGATFAWLALAVPTTVAGIDYAAIGVVNPSANARDTLLRRLSTTVDIDGADYTVWRSNAAYIASFLAGANLYLHPDAAEP